MKVTALNVEDLVNKLYHALAALGHYYHLSDGSMDTDEILLLIESPLPQTYPVDVIVDIQFKDNDNYIYLQTL